MPKIEDVSTSAPLAPFGPILPRWGGFGPMRLEAVTAREQHGPTPGVETPLIGTPTGFGEWLPVLPGEQPPRDTAIIRDANHLSFD